MKKSLLAVSLMSLFLAACGQSEQAPAPAPAPASETSAPVVMDTEPAASEAHEHTPAASETEMPAAEEPVAGSDASAVQ